MGDIGAFYVEQYSALEEKRTKRRMELKLAADRLERYAQVHIHESVELVMSLERMDTLITSYYYDIIRYKHFHGMLDTGKESPANLQKIFSYTTKWILREMPLYAVISEKYRSDVASRDEKEYTSFNGFANHVNQLWALTWMESSYYQHTKQSAKLNLAEYNGTKNGDFLYLLKYRDFSVGGFEQILDCVMDHELLKKVMDDEVLD
ncbi:MAG: hypothetical protein KAR40_02755 [Candidatus Sabulitectum sp.]|nr:hypothetical protein [Candidatus Sabulitectum sp.]